MVDDRMGRYRFGNGRPFWAGLMVLLALAMVGCSKASRAATRLEKANQFYEAGDYDKAELEYMNVLRVDRTNFVALRNFGLLSFEQTDFLRARFLLEQADKVKGDDPLVRLRLGQLQLAADDGRSSNALHLLARTNAQFVLSREPQNEQALLLLVNSYRRLELGEAGQVLESHRAAAGSSAGFQVAQGLLLLKAAGQDDMPQRMAAAEDVFRKAVEGAPTNLIANSALADLLMAKVTLPSVRTNQAQAEAVVREIEQAMKRAADSAPVRSAERLRYWNFKLATARSTNDVAEVRGKLEDIVKQAPDYVPVVLKLAEMAFQERRLEDCAKYVQQVLTRRPNPGVENVEARFLEANIQLAQNEPEKALAALDKLVQMYPNYPKGHLAMAKVLARQRDLNRAMASADRALSLSQGRPMDATVVEASLLQAELKRRRDDNRTAIDLLQNVVRRLPELAQSREVAPLMVRQVEGQARLKLIEAYADAGQVPAALAEAATLAKAYPTNAQVWYVQGMLHGMQTNLAEASRCFEEALRMAPRFYDAAEKLNGIDVSRQQFAAAEARTQQLMQDDPKSPVPHHLLATVYLAQRDFARTEASLVKALELAPDFSPSYSLLAQVYVATQRVPEAIQRLEAAIASQTNNVGAMLQIAGIQTLSSNYVGARDTFEKVLKISTNNLPALNDLAYLYTERLNDLDRALELATKAHALASAMPDRPELARYVYAATDTLGWVHYRRGDYGQALTLLRESAEHLPFDAEIAYHLGMTYYMLGEEGSASTYLRRALADSSKTFSGIETARERLAVLSLEGERATPEDKARLEAELAKSPNDPIVLGKLAVVLEREGAAERAAAMLEKAVSRQPKAIGTRVRLAKLYAGPLKAPEKGLQQAREAYKLAPQEPGVLADLARVGIAGGDFVWAQTLLLEAGRRAPADPEIALDLASVTFSVGQVNAAGAALQRALAGGTNLVRTVEARNLQAFLAAVSSAAAPPGVGAIVQETLARQPDHVPAMLTSAVLLEQAGKAAEAAAQYEQVLRRVPTCALAHRQLALLYAGRLNDPKKAFDAATMAREAFPDDPLVARALGILAGQRSEFARAAQLLTEAGRKIENDAELHYYLGRAQYNLKQSAPAKASLEKAVSLSLSPALAAEAKKMLAELK